MSACNEPNVIASNSNLEGHTAVLPSPLFDSTPAWSPDGTTIAFHNNGYFYAPDAEGGYGRHLDSMGIWFIAPDGSDKRMFLPGAFEPAWGPQGKWLVFNYGSQIFKIMANGDSLTQLTFEGANFFPAISPDGNAIAYDSNVDDSFYASSIYDVWVMDADGSNKVNISAGQGGRRPRWSPDGNRIAHERANPVTETDIYTMDKSGSQATFLSPGRAARYSPDGTQIAFMYEWQIWLMNTTGGNQIQLTFDTGSEPSWSPDGRQIVYYGPQKTLWIMDSDGLNNRQLTFPPDSLSSN